MSSGSQRPPAPLFTAACCAVAGILLADQAASLRDLALVLLPAALIYVLTAPGRLPWLALLLLAAGTAHHWRREHSPSRELARSLPAGETRSAILVGTVAEVPEPKTTTGGPQRCKFRLLIENGDAKELAIPGAELLIHAGGAPPRVGERLRLRAAIRKIPPARNPGQPDMASLWSRRGIWAEGFASHPQDTEILSAPAFWQPRQWAAQCRLWISDALARGIENQPLEHSLIASMVLGLRSAGLGEAETWFRETGTLHLFAVSGLNLTMLAWLLTTGFRMGGAGPRLTAFLTLPILAVYALTVGFSPSCLRALLGTVLFLGCVWVESPSVAYNNIGAAALVLLFADTNALFQGGFQLSFSLVLALLWIATPLGMYMGRLSQPDPLLPRKLWSRRQRWRVRLGVNIATTVAASLVTFVGGLPWSYLVFHLVSPAGILVNLLVIPLAFAILSLGLLSVFSAPLGPVSPWINNANAHLAHALLKIVSFGSKLSQGHWAVANPFARRPDFVVFDVGNGGAVLLDVTGKPWLLDCGSEAQFELLLLPGLRCYGLNRLEGLVLSHGDAAHIGGLLATQRAFQPPHLLEPAAKDRSQTRKRLVANLASAGKAPIQVAAGDTPQDAPDPKVEILFPPRGLQASLADDKGLVVRFSTQRWSVLYTADAGYPTERWLLEHRPEQLHADVWVRGNHAREVTGTDAFVEAVNPSLIVISGASFGQDSQRTQRWAEYWRARGKAVWLQHETGAVEGWGGTERRARAFLTGSELRW